MNRSNHIIKSDYLIVAALTAIAGLSRFYGLSEWHLMADEYYTYYDAAKDSKTLINPAYYLLTLISFGWFGVSEWAARLPAAILGVLAVPILYLCWQKIIGRHAALIAAIVTIFSSWHLWYSQQARFYSGVYLFGGLAYYCFYRSVREDNPKMLALGCVLALVATSFHLTAILIPISFGAYCLVILLFNSARESQSARIAKIYLILCAVLSIAAIPFLLDIVGRWMGFGQAWGYGPLALILQIVKYVQLPIVICALFGLISLALIDRWKAIFIAISVGIPFLCLCGMSLFFAVRPDYAFYTLPLVIALCGIACATTMQQLRDKSVLAQALTALVVAVLLPEFASNYTGRNSLDVRDTLRFVEEQFQEGDRVMSFVGGFNHYTKRTYKLDRIPGNPYDGSVNWEKAFAALQVDGTRMWIVVPVSRKLPAPRLNRWLMENGRLAWRDTAVRFDYTHRGYEVFLIEPE